MAVSWAKKGSGVLSLGTVSDLLVANSHEFLPELLIP